MLASLVVCFFARGVYTPDVVQQALAAADFERSADDLARLGAETLRGKYSFKIREGFDPTQLRIPRRILETSSALGPLDEGFLRRAMQLMVEGL